MDEMEICQARQKYWDEQASFYISDEPDEEGKETQDDATSAQISCDDEKNKVNFND